MNVKAQICMVMNLDKCIGCHTCSIPCKHVWTNHEGAEYIWYNDVETKPGIGYPKQWEDQQRWRGGWTVEDGLLRLLAGDRAIKLASIFWNPDLPQIDDYYEPWTYDYAKLINRGAGSDFPTLRPRSVLSKQNLDLKWGPNWDDDLGGLGVTGQGDIDFEGLDFQTYLEFKNVFMFWLPRICEHCLNPACVASCPSGALYKRDEDGIVLVDQERCRGWRFCVSGCPYKKVYFNWKTGRSEKCIFCYPRIEAGLPTLCAEDCVGRIRSIGVLLYDADRIKAAASVPDGRDVYGAQLSLFLDPRDSQVVDEAKRNGMAPNVLDAAAASPIYKLAVEWRLALPLHSEFRTLPMVWYLPPLSPIVRAVSRAAQGEVWPELEDIERMQIPVRYLANLFTAGDEAPVRLALQRLVALRIYMRSQRVDGAADMKPLERAGLSEVQAKEMYDLLALSPYNDRYVIPTVRREMEPSEDLRQQQGLRGYPPGSQERRQQ